ncbi:hypothetical protein ACVWXO_005345 [Bradyrhizobium sp. LM2.7]
MMADFPFRGGAGSGEQRTPVSRQLARFFSSPAHGRRCMRSDGSPRQSIFLEISSAVEGDRCTRHGVIAVHFKSGETF